MRGIMVSQIIVLRGFAAELLREKSLFRREFKD